jgi:hypothetical protein
MRRNRLPCKAKLPSPTNLARLGHFPPASQAGRLAGPVFYLYVFSLVLFHESVLSVFSHPEVLNDAVGDLLRCFLLVLLALGYRGGTTIREIALVGKLFEEMNKCKHLNMNQL